ncbi:MAG: PIN domain-containing protein [Pyrinomonadaceae bacterium]|nr:PIN domain-containing protein [Blastocatellia bacterium]MCW5955193.1 PIN domain-containing protein [Pyrinomonadaceae bacterium]
MLNLDTHILLATLFGDLTDREKGLIHRQSLAISDIVLWEMAKLAQMGRIDIDFGGSMFRRALRQLTVYPISADIARQSTKLDFKSDPACEIIAATSIIERIPLLTRDKKILKSKIVPFAK